MGNPIFFRRFQRFRAQNNQGLEFLCFAHKNIVFFAECLSQDSSPISKSSKVKVAEVLYHLLQERSQPSVRNILIQSIYSMLQLVKVKYIETKKTITAIERTTQCKKKKAPWNRPMHWEAVGRNYKTLFIGQPILGLVFDF